MVTSDNTYEGQLLQRIYNKARDNSDDLLMAICYLARREEMPLIEILVYGCEQLSDAKTRIIAEYKKLLERTPLPQTVIIPCDKPEHHIK